MTAPLRAAVIGLGSVAPMHTTALVALDIPIAAVCDKDAARAHEYANTLSAPFHSNPRIFTDCRAMLEAGGFDVLHICLPHFLHAPVAIAALEAGIHVLCEKPVATTVSDAQAMLAAAKKNNRVLSIVFQNRFNPGAVLIKNELPHLGTPVSGWLRVNWHRAAPYYTSCDWRGRIAAAGGGVLINQSIHTFDLMNYFLGEPKRVSAAIANRAHPEAEVEDVAEGIVFYENENGEEVPINFYVTLNHPYDAPAELEIICENGTAKMNGDEAEVSFTRTSADGIPEFISHTASADVEAQERFGVKSYWGVSHIKQIADFYEAIKNSAAPQVSAESALITQKLINDIYTTATSKTF